MLPLTVLRRIDCVLAPTKAQVLEKHSQFKDKIIDLTGSEAITHAQACEIISKVIGRTVKYIDISDAQYPCEDFYAYK